ncbi:CGNR zinc finger domain-containing protein [Roseobacter sp. YSTF-M11]|uniref:CGNR zinc finger domain-containing protein n=1 Tax=Roseobacter insulae TaxID=2859783 RepID=A0A9X1FUJ8_9RHOB|nr:CGNR zinc finger domain-containing protein [Roseobacter insulae]MBW4708200.1 CGNR zinc finger domain-containing protein [Roseobacter insulae]
MDHNTPPEWTSEMLIGGHPALDFVNTAGGSSKLRDTERLLHFGDVLKWSAAAQVVSKAERNELRPRGSGGDHAREVDHLHQFREALHTCLMAEQAGTAWPAQAAYQLHREIRWSLGGSLLQKAGARFSWHAGVEAFGSALPRARIALATEALLRSCDLPRLRNCDRCSWLFIDRGRGRRRRWCSMATCGSREKSAAYYQRRKAAGQ